MRTPAEKVELELDLDYVNLTLIGFMLTDMGENADDLILMGEWRKPDGELPRSER